MHPWLIEHPSISMYGACIVAGLVLAWVWARRRARRAGVEASHIDLMVPVLVGVGLLGAWAFGGWTDALTEERVHGAVLVGSLLVGAAAGIGYALVSGIRLGVMGDICAGPVALGIAVGRLGCFCAGCCFGKVSDGATVLTAVRFPRGSFAFLEQVKAGQIAADAAAALPVYPVQLYEAFLCAALAGAIWRWPRRGVVTLSGEKFLAMGMGYAVIRFGLEWLRGDNPPVVTLGGAWGGFTFSQCAGVGIVVVAAVTWAVRRRFAGRLGLRPVGSRAAEVQPPRVPATP